MFRATKRLVTRVLCLNMKKTKNQRRLVIIVAMIGVYYLGKHSSSLTMAKEPEKRIKRRPGDGVNGTGVNGTVQQPKLSKAYGENFEENLYPSVVEVPQQRLDKEGGIVNNAKPDDPQEDGDNTLHRVTPPAATEQTNQQVNNTLPAVQNHKGDTHTSPQPTSVNPTTHSMITSTDQASDKALVKGDKPKPTIVTAKPTVTTKPTTPQPISSEGSTINNNRKSTGKTPVSQTSINADQVDYHLQDLLKDKNLFGFMNVTEHSMNTSILTTASYSKLLQYQINQKDKPTVPKNVKDPLYKYGFSKSTSDKLPLLRDVPDNRDLRCKDEDYAPNKLDISVITVTQFTESVSVILRMLVSVLYRTPKQVLKEIILIDDATVWDKEESDLLYSFVMKLPKVKIINHNTSVGLARCMNLAAKMATGEVLAFLSPKVEVANDWYISLLGWLAENPNDMVLPVVDPINWNSFEFSKSKVPVQFRGGFTWGLSFRWKAIPNDEKQRRQNLPIELRTPIYNGAVILINRHRYDALLGANEAIEGYDNVAIATELSLKQWMCTGMILTIPCSRVGFLYALENPFPSLQMVKNRLTIAESLMDNYKKHFYSAQFLTNESSIIKNFNANIEITKMLREKLNCKSFEWYLENVYYDKKEPRADSQYAGLIRSNVGGLCVDASAYTIGRLATCRHCNSKSLTQLFEMDISGTLTYDEDYILGQRKTEPSPGSSVEVLKRRTMSKNQEWKYDPETTHLMHTASGLCMSCLKGTLTLEKCDDNNREMQGWSFDWKRPT